MSRPLPDVVLVSPVIAQNTGSIARTCAGIGNHLHLIHPFHFSFESRHLKRAGLDYWDFATMCVHMSWDAFVKEQRVQADELLFLSTKADRTLLDFPDHQLEKARFLVFGSETQGLPTSFYEQYSQRLALIPQSFEAIRSYNQAVSVGLALGICMEKLR